MTTKTNLPLIDLKGASLGEVSVPVSLFGIEPNEAVLHFVCEGQRFRFWKHHACTKTRSAVRGGGRKIRNQKGGGAGRQGGIRAPHWVGGGIAFGPTPIKRDFKINKKVRQIALASVLSDRYSGGQIRVLKSDLAKPATKTVDTLLNKLSLQTARVGFVVSSKTEAALVKSVRNIKNIDLLTEEKWTALDFVKTDTLIFSEAALKSIATRFAGSEN
jgi:large subunit ribosomal protein L4